MNDEIKRTETQNKIIIAAQAIADLIDQAPAHEVGSLRHSTVSIIAPEFLKGGRDSGVMQLGLTYDTTTRIVSGVHGGKITGNTLTYNRYIAGKKETVTEALPERISFSA